MSRFFVARPPASPAAASQSPSAAREARLPSNGARGKRVVIPARLLDAAKQAGRALEEFRTVARRKNAHTEHSDAAEAVLIPFRPFVRAKVDAAKAAKDGDVRPCLAGDASATTAAAATNDGGGEETPPTARRDATSGGACRAIESRGAEVLPSEPRVVAAPCTGAPPGASEAGAVLFEALTELDRLHVNASCRVRQRAPAVAEARARLTALRRECRDAFRALDESGFERVTRDRARRKRNLPAARDAREFARRGAAASIAEVRDRCALMRATGSPHHLCLDLCYYREYDAARRLFVLRTRLAAATGSAAALDGWRAELRAATAEEMGAREAADGDGTDTPDAPDEPDERMDFLLDPDTADADEDGLFEAFRSPTASPTASPAASPAGVKTRGTRRLGDARATSREKKRKRNRNRARRDDDDARGGWLSARSLPWRVVFVSPEGERIENPAAVLERLGVRDAPVAAATAAGGGGLGAETEADFDGVGGSAAAADAAARRARDPAGARAEGRVQPPRRRVALNLGVAGSHGGSGVRLARPDERGLDAATDVLRAALWPPGLDDEVCASPVRERREAARAGAPRSPVRVAATCDSGDDERRADVADAAARTGLETDVSREAGNPDPDPWDRDRDRDPRDAAAASASRFVPPRSPFGLLEEILWEDEWKMLVACMMLNCTTRVQVDRVLWRLFATTPTPEAAVALGRRFVDDSRRGSAATTARPAELDAEGFSVAGAARLEALLAPLGLHRKRARAFVRLSEDYLRARDGAAAGALPARAGSEDADTRSEEGRATRERRLLRAPVASLHGVGAYASDAHALFCEGVLGVAPRDHALRWWYAWAIERREGERRRAAEQRRAGRA